MKVWRILGYFSLFAIAVMLTNDYLPKAVGIPPDYVISMLEIKEAGEWCDRHKGFKGMGIGTDSNRKLHFKVVCEDTWSMPWPK